MGYSTQWHLFLQIEGKNFFLPVVNKSLGREKEGLPNF